MQIYTSKIITPYCLDKKDNVAHSPAPYKYNVPFSCLLNFNKNKTPNKHQKTAKGSSSTDNVSDE